MVFLKKILKLITGSTFITFLSTTLGVLLAFYLDNRSSKQEIEHKVKVSIENIFEELDNNIDQLKDSTDIQLQLEMYYDIGEINPELSSELTTTTETIQNLRSKYGEFIEVIDSSKTESSEYTYSVSYSFQVSLFTLSKIAWESAKTAGIMEHLKYETLLSLTQIYELQELFNEEQQKTFTPIIEERPKEFVMRTRIVEQLRAQLLYITQESVHELKTKGNSKK